ncbi:hypothetical protein [Streptomyces sp. NPDC057460]|uniref:hypothetical protein n=1 Tax=Streptomyces sp. NPDC057460 TaxID=3346141 RepID=UPI0036A5C59E
MDYSLHTRIRAGGPEAFRELFRHHARLVHRHAMRVTGDWTVGGSSGIAGLPGGFCCGLQQAGGQSRKSQQVRARCRAAGVAYQRVQLRDRRRVQPGRGVPS